MFDARISAIRVSSILQRSNFELNDWQTENSNDLIIYKKEKEIDLNLGQHHVWDSKKNWIALLLKFEYYSE